MASSPITIMESTRLGYLRPYEIYVESWQHGDIYSNAWRGQKSRNPKDDFEGPLREGDVADLFSARYAGLLVSAGVLGFVSTVVAVAVGSRAIGFANAGCYLKVFFALVSDSVALAGFRRKSYMLFGWIIAVVAFLVASCAGQNNYVFLGGVSLASAGLGLTKAAADGFLVELAQREPIETRGGTQITLLALHWFGASVASLLVACLTEDSTGFGHLIWALDTHSVLRIVAVVSLVPIPALLFYVHESTLLPAFEFRRRCYTFWRFLQNKAMWQLAAFELLSGTLFSQSTLAVGYSPLLFFKTSYPWIIHLVFFVLFAYSLAYMQSHGLSWNWQRAFLLTALANAFVLVVLTALVTSVGLDASSGFSYVAVWLTALPTATQYMLRHVPMIEIAPTGFEATTVAILSLYGETAHPLVMRMHAAYQTDGHLTASSLYVAMGLSLVGFLSIFLLPKQRTECLTLRHFGGLSKLAAFTVASTLVAVPVLLGLLGWPGSSISRI
ncbi:transmembrane protein [Achlya hypogyna]|uniref:Transmembrane protein n=1 Tax=Achlya hypogyna TaxID=1202772 RepID=A0A1V9YQ62_ACHHY|nr:transmembrane protein [Achlya hypogyna]